MTHNLSRLLASAMVAVCLCGPSVAQNLLVNGGFEDPIAGGPAPFFGRWEPFSGGMAAGSGNSSAMPFNEAMSLELSIAPGSTMSFAGAFQDAMVLAGQEYTYSGWHKSLGSSGGSEIRIEWRDSVANVEISRTPNFVPMVGSDYEPFELNVMAPAGADSARVVYAIQSFGAAPDQLVYVDDVSFAVIPEPASLGLLAFAGLSLLAIRRR